MAARNMIWLALLISTLALDRSAAADDASDGARAIEILQRYCAKCHTGASAEGNFDYVVDATRLIERKKIVPGQPENSKLLQRMTVWTLVSILDVPNLLGLTHVYRRNSTGELWTTPVPRANGGWVSDEAVATFCRDYLTKFSFPPAQWRAPTGMELAGIRSVSDTKLEIPMSGYSRRAASVPERAADGELRARVVCVAAGDPPAVVAPSWRIR